MRLADCRQDLNDPPTKERRKMAQDYHQSKSPRGESENQARLLRQVIKSSLWPSTGSRESVNSFLSHIAIIQWQL